MKSKLVFGLLLSSVLSMPLTGYADQKSEKVEVSKNDNYFFVKDMRDFVARNTVEPEHKGKRYIIPDQYMVFDGKLMSMPKEQMTDYVKMAMGIAKVNPVPEVNHAMYIEVAENTVIPVYVAMETVKELVEIEKKYGFDNLQQSRLRFAGIHVYNYSKGPAIVVESLSSVKE